MVQHMEISVIQGNIAEQQADCLVVNLFEGVTTPGGATGTVDKALGGAISRLIAGGEIVEYSAQAIHRGGVHLIPQLYGDGYVVAGSAARLLLNNVMTLRGMDVAVASAAAAAQAILAAREGGSYSATALSAYERFFKETDVYKDMVTFKDTYSLLENKRLFHVYPDLVGGVMGDMFTVGDHPAKKGLGALRDNMRDKVSLWEMFKDMAQIGKGLVR